MSPSLLTEIHEHAVLGPNEDMLLVSYRRTSQWCLLTTQRLIWFQERAAHSLAWKEIVGAQQPPEQAAPIIRQELPKDEISDLEVFDAEGRRHTLTLKEGEAYYVIWSAILVFCNYVRRVDPVDL